MDNVEITMHALQEFGWVFDLTQWDLSIWLHMHVACPSLWPWPVFLPIGLHRNKMVLHLCPSFLLKVESDFHLYEHAVLVSLCSTLYTQKRLSCTAWMWPGWFMPTYLFRPPPGGRTLLLWLPSGFLCHFFELSQAEHCPLSRLVPLRVRLLPSPLWHLLPGLFLPSGCCDIRHICLKFARWLPGYLCRPFNKLSTWMLWHGICRSVFWPQVFWVVVWSFLPLFKGVLVSCRMSSLVTHPSWLHCFGTSLRSRTWRAVWLNELKDMGFDGV